MSEKRKECELKGYREEYLIEKFKDKRLIAKIYLLSGLKLKGVILGVDKFSILLSSKEFGSQLIYKHAIATISSTPV